MSIFISPQDYTISANECAKITYAMLGCNYSFWCKKEKENQAIDILNKISSFAEKYQKRHQNISIDKLLLIVMTEYIAKIEDKKSEKYLQSDNNDNEDVIAGNNVIAMKEYNQTKQELEFNKILLKQERNKNIQAQKKYRETILRLKNILEDVKKTLHRSEDDTCDKNTTNSN